MQAEPRQPIGGVLLGVDGGVQVGVGRGLPVIAQEPFAEAAKLLLKEGAVRTAPPARVIDRQHRLSGLDEIDQHGAQALQRVAGVRHEDQIDVLPGSGEQQRRSVADDGACVGLEVLVAGGRDPVPGGAQISTGWTPCARSSARG